MPIEDTFTRIPATRNDPGGDPRPKIRPQHVNQYADALVGLPTAAEAAATAELATQLTPANVGEEVAKGQGGALFSVISRVNAAAFSTPAAALAEGDGKTVYFPAGSYSISDVLTPAAGTTVENHPNAVYEQLTEWTPIYDLLDVPDVQVLGGQYEWNGARAEVGGLPSFRDAAGINQSTAFWTNSDRTRIIGAKTFGFLRSVFVQGWNGTTTIAGYTHDVVIEDVEVDTIQTGITAAGTTNLNLHRIRGSISTWTGSQPGHLIYTTEHSIGDYTSNKNVNISDCYQDSAVNGGPAYQLKGLSGGRATGLYAGTVPSLLLVMQSKDFVVDGLGAQSCTDTTGWAVAFSSVTAADVERCRVENIVLSSLADGLLAVLIDGTFCEARNISAVLNSSTTDATKGAVLIQEADNTAENVLITEEGAGSVSTVISSGDRSRIRDIRSNKAQYLVRVTAGSADVSYDPTMSTTLQTGAYRLTGGASARLTIPPTRTSDTYSVGTGAEPNPSRHTVSAYTATGANVSVNNPRPTTESDAAQHTIEITNSSGGALTVLWGAAYVFGPAWASPADGKTTFITFQYDGTNWVEMSRTA